MLTDALTIDSSSRRSSGIIRKEHEMFTVEYRAYSGPWGQAGTRFLGQGTRRVEAPDREAAVREVYDEVGAFTLDVRIESCPSCRISHAAHAEVWRSLTPR